MKVEIGRASFWELHEALGNSRLRSIAGVEQKLDYLAMLSQYVWCGKVDGEIICAFGVIPPCAIATTAYLWSISTDKVEEHKFLFVRYSQRMIEMIQKEYPTIIGHVGPNDKAIRWLRWLGAKFGEPTEKGIPFVIERKDNGA